MATTNKQTNNLMPETKKDLRDLFNSFLNYKHNIWNKIEKFDKIGQYKNILISTFLCFLTVTAEILKRCWAPSPGFSK